MQSLMQQIGGGRGRGAPSDAPLNDTAETIYVSSLALLKMLKHGRAGVPMEVMGMLLGDFVDDYTVKVVDVFAMPQSGTAVSVETIDEIFQQEMLELLKATNRTENVVGWYHSHPGFGCWLSGVDINTQSSFEKLHPRCVAVVVDPIQSVKGKVVIDAFRNIPPDPMPKTEARQTTSNVGHLSKPSIQALIHGLNHYYYSMPISYRKNDLETRMLMNLHKRAWSKGMELGSFESIANDNAAAISEIHRLSKLYHKAIIEEGQTSLEKFAVESVGKIDARKRLQESVDSVMGSNILQILGTMLDSVAF